MERGCHADNGVSGVSPGIFAGVALTRCGPSTTTREHVGSQDETSA